MKIGSDAQIAVIGHGSWATAIVKLINSNGHHVNWYIRNPEVLEGIESEGVNPKYLSDIEFDKSLLNSSGNLDEVVSDSNLIILAAPSNYLKLFLEPLTIPLEDKFILSAVKGIIPGEYQTVSEYIHDKHKVSYSQIGIIAGPTHAEEVSHGKLTYLSIACSDKENAEAISNLIHSSHLICTTSDDIYGIEYASMLKNIYAIASGMATGLGYGDNFLSVLVAGSAAELERFISQTYPFERQQYKKLYLADLLVTCYSNFSRNRRFGQLIGKGVTVKSALNEMTMIAEGYFGAECIHHINEKYNIQMPIAQMVYDVLYKGVRVRPAMKNLSLLL